MTRLATIKAAAMKLIRKMLPLLAGNLPRMIQYYQRVSQLEYGSVAAFCDAPVIIAGLDNMLLFTPDA